MQCPSGARDSLKPVCYGPILSSTRFPQRRKFTVYKEFAIEAVVWLIPVAVLLGLAWMITATA
ncbi:hypothetical protein Ppa06_35930 [Planomonospora parontospora subsp. parontospora]|uniref:Uncharacterized protein n=2 Tax=Planomonospora parontospora TaxID=58119 RepID=A0AA37BHT2_9ACTN|nr:hypothetical protein GCM10010126_32510 [Planomonospora parontospora]GII09795.1 hypothetical protein Ppa06_35930 [Planomonospora parontospora subsp. parontospora]